MKCKNEKLKLKKVLNCRFEETSKDQATNLPGRNSSLFSSRLGAQKKNRMSEFFKDLSPRFKAHFVCFCRREEYILWWYHVNKFLENKSGQFFCVRQVYLPTNLGACKPTFYTFYTSHLRWNSTFRRFFYHTDLGKNAVFQNFAIQISLIKDLGRWKHGSHFWQPPNEWTIIELRFTIIKNLLFLFFI